MKVFAYLCAKTFFMRGTVVYMSIFAALALLVGGAYFTIDNIIEPQGLLFEGIASMALGLILLMILVVAKTIGDTIMIFGDILEQTTELNKQIANAQQKQRPNLTSLFSGMFPPGSMTVTDLDTGKTTTEPIGDNPGENIGKMNDMIANVLGANLPGKKPGGLNSLTDKELEDKLAKAIKKDDFEEAAKINAILKDRREPGEKPEENNPE